MKCCVLVLLACLVEHLQYSTPALSALLGSVRIQHINPPPILVSCVLVAWRSEVIDRQLGISAAPAGKSVWGVAAGPGKGPSLREVMQYEESAADLEGGAPTGR